MADYSTRIGPRTGATVWRVRSGGHEQRVLPDATMDLMWFRDALIVAGPDTRSMIATTEPGAATWGLQLAPGVAHAILGVSAHDLADRRVELTEIARLPRAARRRSGQTVPDMLERVLVALWDRATPERAVLRLAASLDDAARRGLTASEAAALHALSVRSLHRISTRLFGYGFKTLAQIHRFQRALGLAREGAPLSHAAAAAGFTDQAHLNRESKRLTGRTPAQLTRNG